jgi:hypothetical protein
MAKRGGRVPLWVMNSIFSRWPRTAELLAEGGFQSRVVDFEFFAFHTLFEQRKDQIDRVEELSDAYHLRFRDEDVMVAYLLEVTPA